MEEYKRITSVNGIPLIVNGKYCWKIINDPQVGEVYQIVIGECYLAKGEDYYELIYYSYNNRLLLFAGMSEFDCVGNDVTKLRMTIDFKDVEMIIDALVKGGNLTVYPLYLTSENC